MSFFWRPAPGGFSSSGFGHSFVEVNAMNRIREWETESSFKCGRCHSPVQPQVAGATLFSTGAACAAEEKNSGCFFIGKVPFAITDLAINPVLGFPLLDTFLRSGRASQDNAERSRRSERSEWRVLTGSRTELSLSNRGKPTQREAVRPNTA